jgi:ferredoxin-nitrate reductase
MGFARHLNYNSAADIFDEFARSTAGRPNDQSALHHELLRSKGPQHWPYPALTGPAARRYTNGHFPTASGRARFWPRPHDETKARPKAEFPIVLTTGRLISQWHTRTKTGVVAQLNANAAGAFVTVHPTDLARLGLRDGQQVYVQGERGRSRTSLRVDPNILPGVAFIPIHFNDSFAEHASPNESTDDSVDPISKQPSLKRSDVRIVAETSGGEPIDAHQGVRTSSGTFATAAPP